MKFLNRNTSSARKMLIALVCSLMLLTNCKKTHYPSPPPVSPPPPARVPVAPIANAGNDTTINLPFNTYNLDAGKSMDADSNIVSYEWKWIAGPMQTSIRNHDRSRAFAIGLKKEGVYEFELTIIDADGLITKDTIKITVSQPDLTGSTGEVILNNLPWNYDWIMEIDLEDFLSYLPPNSYLKNIYIKRDPSTAWEPVVPLDYEDEDYTYHTWEYGNNLLAIYPSASNLMDDTPDIKIEYSF